MGVATGTAALVLGDHTLFEGTWNTSGAPRRPGLCVGADGN